jgi:hypothetical protein
MARNFYGIEKGLDIYAENGALQARILTGTAVPDGLLDQASAPIGSIYLRSGTGAIYQKIANAGNSTDWQLNGAGSASVGTWRPESIKVVTNDTISIGVRDLTASPLADDNAPLLTAADFTVGDYVISDADGTPALLEVTVVSSPNVTFAAAASPLVAEDTFVAVYYLPDPAGGESKAIVNYNGTIVVKLSDIDWQIATGINLSGAYAAASGNVAANDTIEVAIQKLDGVNDAQDSLLGIAQGGTNLGSWTSPVDLLFSATSTVKALFQRIGDLLMQLRGVQVAGITTSTMVDQVPTASVKAVKWFVEAFEVATPANRMAFEVFAINNGTLVDDNKVSVIKVGSSFNLTSLVDISGGNMRLMVASTTAGATVTVRRVEVVKSVL